MSPSVILDSHIHLWPSTSLSPTAHGWMTPGHVLAKRHGISDYKSITSPPPTGFIYVETDRYLPSPAPLINENDTLDQKRQVIATWAKEPLEEIKFLRRIVEGATEDGDGVDAGEERLMKGCVIYAPFHIHPDLFAIYLHLAEDAAGPKLWNEKVVGFRYLLQGKAAGEVPKLVGSDAWVQNILSLADGRNGKGWAFDVGVDTHRDGFEALEAVGGMIREVREREKGTIVEGRRQPVRFVLNHLCKPHLTAPPNPALQWTSALRKLSSDRNSYMKLSGAFNEFDQAPLAVSDIVSILAPFVDTAFDCFADRVMFGSDWPVCNVGGPSGESGNWNLWVEVVDELLKRRKSSDGEAQRVWVGAAAEAYGVKV